ncbi:MAG TPA: hypothetical protein VFE58_02415 [Tepidisphaeraceae bacterium]|nr:hypothetical protein [Tepidisphaeraceae bacterium]
MKISRCNNSAPITEITIQPDGRIYVQGLSRDLIQILATLQPDDPHIQNLLQHLQNLESLPPTNPQS